MYILLLDSWPQIYQSTGTNWGKNANFLNRFRSMKSIFGLRPDKEMKFVPPDYGHL